MSLIVEDGSGLASAESYASVAEADLYHAAQGNPSTWSGASTPTKEAALRQATTYLDGKYGARFRGRRKTEDQSLKWPRHCAIDDDGYTIDSGSVPPKLKSATAEIALKVVEGSALFVDEATPGSLEASTLKIGLIEISETFQGGQSAQPAYQKARALLTDLLEPLGIRERA